MTIEQQAVLNEPAAIAVSGGPGTGKSVVSLWRHIRNYGIGNKKSLLLTYTVTLRTYLAASARSEHTVAGDNVDRTYRWTHAGNKVNYDEIIVDEAQDVEAERYDIIRRFAPSVSYGADDKQIVFPDKATTEQLLSMQFPQNRSYILYENFRNSYEIMLFVRSMLPNILIPQSTIDTLLEEGKRGNKPTLLVTNSDKGKQDKAIIDIINEFRSDTHNIAILVPLTRHVEQFYSLISSSGIRCSKYVNQDEELLTIENVHVSTFKSSKGTEFDTVIIPDFDNYHWNIANLTIAKITESDYYVALTRARRNLFLISRRDLPFLNTYTYQKELL
ncbi:3'-5' exonuclease [Rufibacter sp. XAAS-G3-1]|uniref:3'-5' exonuclease n=1 Tax=Rufibacter sp. XAAS-G3-1 TaxID=2729134 RepID=UPI0015E644B6|nr:3'-5' exonuclease [Rufibacter sp. XAAS-G3-1]